MRIVIAKRTDAERLALIIRQSNKKVAQQFGIRRDNNPKHPSFCTHAWVLDDFDRGARYFLYEHQGLGVGCVCYETADHGVVFLNRLAVLPEHQHCGIGAALIDFFFAYARSHGMQKISIGTIAAHSILNNWYLKLGFVAGETRQYPHLPFDVTFMTYDL